MIIAWIGSSEIVPFEAISFVDDMDENQATVNTEREYVLINGKENVARFKKEYTAWLNHIGKALTILEGE